MMQQIIKKNKNIMSIVVILFTMLGFTTSSALAENQKWSLNLKPGDIVCLWDIHRTDPLVHDRSSSFKHWYKNRDEKSRFELRPQIQMLQLKVLHPGLEVVVKTKNKIKQTWYSGWLLVEKGGEEIDLTRAIRFKLGKSTLYNYQGTYPIPNHHLIHFEAARFKKGRAVLGCKRKYNK